MQGDKTEVVNIELLEDYLTHLTLEKSLSKNSIDAYLSDIQKLVSFYPNKQLSHIEQHDVVQFLNALNDLELSPRSLARVISGLKSFYNFLLIEEYIESSPLETIDSPKLPKKLPDVVGHDDIMKMIASIDYSKIGAERDKLVLMLLYGSGLRVSELVSLKLDDLYFEEEFIKVLGKGNKERLVPLSNKTAKQIKQYLQYYYNEFQTQQTGNNLIINQRGNPISRIYIFKVIKKLAEKAQLSKSISPHTLRHSFATVMIEAGADLRAVQQMLGHENLTTTEIYTHLDKSYLKTVIEEFHPQA